MQSFKRFRVQIDETVKTLNEKTIDSFKVGKDKLEAEIRKKGSKYVAYVDGDELDEFKSEKEARKGIEDFVKLMDV
jgi:hypothetical protein